ncbi:MAG: cytochrome P450 [Myxococcales bacterium]|nr:cytochrome P450 [Myxococcales bacterium]
MAATYVSVETLPMLPGRLPLVGHTLQMLRSFPELIFAGRERFGPLFRIDGGRIRDTVVIADLEGMRLLAGRQVSSDAMNDAGGPVLEDSIITQDGARHRRQRTVLQRPFVPRGLDMTTVGDLIAEETAACIAGWRREAPIPILVDMQRVALKILFRMIGCEARELDEWTKLYGRLMLGSFGVPGLGQVSRQAQRELHRRLGQIVAAKRESGEQDSLLGKMANTTDEDGELLPLEELVSTLRVMVLAGHETSATSAAWGVIELARNPEFWKRLVAEAETVERPPRTTAEFEQTPFALAYAREIVRRHSPVASLVRRLREDIDLLGHRLPAGAAIMTPVVMLNIDPELFDDPLAIRPERWLDESTVMKGRELERLAFGLTGPHFCIGYHLALLELVHIFVAVAKTFAARNWIPSLRGGTVKRRAAFPLVQPSRKTTIWID